MIKSMELMFGYLSHGIQVQLTLSLKLWVQSKDLPTEVQVVLASVLQVVRTASCDALVQMLALSRSLFLSLSLSLSLSHFLDPPCFLRRLARGCVELPDAAATRLALGHAQTKPIRAY